MLLKMSDGKMSFHHEVYVGGTNLEGMRFKTHMYDRAYDENSKEFPKGGRPVTRN